MTILVFANGDIDDVTWIRPYLAQASAVIAADGGSRHLWALDHPPDVIIGDMDSLPAEVRLWAESSGSRFEPHPAAKDETDLELALLLAAGRDDKEIWLFGTLGGRLDQTLANILLLAHPALAEKHVLMVNQFERAWLVTGSTDITGSAGDTVSLIPLGGDVLVETTSGLQWPLQEESLVFGPARGVSNLMTGGRASLTISSGRLLCIHTRQVWQR